MTLVLPAPLDVVDAAFDGSIAVEIGDLIFHDTNDAKPASSQADQGSEAANQAAFVPRFLGVAVERKLSTDAAGTLQVAVDVIREYACVASAFEIGDWVTVDEAASGTALENQKLVKTTDPSLAIGYVIKRYGSAVTTVLVRLMSNVLPPTMLGTTAITTTTGVFSTSLTAPVLVFSGATGTPEIRLTTNLADALSIEDSAGDLMVFTTTTGSQLITVTPALTVTGLITSNGGLTLSGAVDLTFSGTTGQPEIVVPTNLADALSIRDSAADIIVITTTTGQPAVTITPATTITGALTLGGAFAPKAITTPVAAAGSTVADAGQLGNATVVHITSDGAAKGVKLPSVTAAGPIVFVINDSSTAAELYAESTGTVNGLAPDASVVVPASKGLICFATAAKTWLAFDMTSLASAS